MVLVDSRGRVLQFSESVAQLVGWPTSTAGRRLPGQLHAFLTEASTRRKHTCFVTLNGTRLRVDCYWLADTGGTTSRQYALYVQRDDPKALRAANAAHSLGLTRRQQEVCARIADGQEYREIAAELGISASTVIDHVRRIHRRLGVRNRAKLVALLEQTATGAEISV